MNGKIVTNIDLAAAVAAHKKHGALATLVLKENSNREHFSMVEIDKRGWITRFAGFPDRPVPEALTASPAAPDAAPNGDVPLMFTGIQVLAPRIFDYIPRSCFSHSTIDVYPRAIESKEPVIAYVSNEDWFEMSTLGRYLEANLRLTGKDGRCVVAGQGSIIEHGAIVENSVLWDNVLVERGARVSQAVLADGVRIPAGAVIEKAVVVRRGIVSEVERGEFSGDNLIVPL